MNELKYYPCGFSGVDFLSEEGSAILHSEYLENESLPVVNVDRLGRSIHYVNINENILDRVRLVVE